MNKTSSIVVVIIIVIFLVGIAYIAGRNSVTNTAPPPVTTTSIAPDGSEIQGPGGAPSLGGHTADGDPRIQTKGPTQPPPGGTQ